MVLNDDSILLQTFPNGNKVTFVCEVGYETAGGSGTITCEGGNWSPVRLKCESKYDLIFTFSFLIAAIF